MAENESGSKPEDRDAVDIAVERQRQELLKLKAEFDSLRESYIKQGKELDKAKSFLEQNERAKAVDELRSMGCTYGMEELDRMQLTELDNLRTHYRYFKPVFKSSSDVSGSRKSIYDSLDDVYVPLEDRKRKMQEG